MHHIEKDHPEQQLSADFTLESNFYKTREQIYKEKFECFGQIRARRGGNVVRKRVLKKCNNDGRAKVNSNNSVSGVKANNDLLMDEKGKENRKEAADDIIGTNKIFTTTNYNL